MKKILAMVLALALLLTGCAKSGGGKDDPIKVGHIANMSGPSAAWGNSEKNALILEIERINAAGGVLGRRLELISYDMKSDNLEAVNATRRLISDGAVAIIGPPASGAGIAMAPITNPENIAFIATVSTNAKVTVNEELGGTVKTAFRVCFIDPFQGTVAARYAVDDLGAQTYAVIYDVGSDYSQGLEECFREEMDLKGATMVSREGFRSNEVDFRAILGKIKDANPDVIYVPTELTPVSMIVKQAADLGITSKFLSCDAASTPDFVDLAGPASEGVYMTSIADMEDPQIADWLVEYRERFDQDPILPNPVMATDALRALVYAIEQAGGTDRAKIVEQLGKITDLPVLSGKLTIDPETHNPVDKPVVIQTVTGGAIRFHKLIQAD